jgi:hypothetical protein
MRVIAREIKRPQWSNMGFGEHIFLSRMMQKTREREARAQRNREKGRDEGAERERD